MASLTIWRINLSNTLQTKEDQNLIPETQIATIASCIESITNEQTLSEIQTILNNQFDVLRSQKTARRNFYNYRRPFINF